MAEETPEFGIQRIYVKDSSFEAPASPLVFRKEWKPDVKLDIHTSNDKVEDDVFEVILRVTATVKLENEVAFVAETKQAGIFTIKNLPEDNMGNALHAYCPTILFPYAREVISDLVTRGSFPQLLLAPVNFDALYAEHQKKAGDGDSAPKEVQH